MPNVAAVQAGPRTSAAVAVVCDAGAPPPGGRDRLAVSSRELAVHTPREAAVPLGASVSPVRGRRSDAALVRAARRGDGAALEELFRRHWPALYRAAYLVVHDGAAA